MRLSDNVGNTPLIPITLGNLTVWGKAEFMNPGGSVKDRMATYIIFLFKYNFNRIFYHYVSFFKKCFTINSNSVPNHSTYGCHHTKN